MLEWVLQANMTQDKKYCKKIGDINYGEINKRS